MVAGWLVVGSRHSPIGAFVFARRMPMRFALLMKALACGGECRAPHVPLSSQERRPVGQEDVP